MDINIKCFCRMKEVTTHCEGEMWIQPDTVYREKVYMVTLIDTGGSEESSMWLTKDQLTQLAKDILEQIK